jgi:hypothetical protein
LEPGICFVFAPVQYLFIVLFNYLFIYLFIYSFIYFCIYLFVYLFIYLCIYLFIYNLLLNSFLYLFVRNYENSTMSKVKIEESKAWKLFGSTTLCQQFIHKMPKCDLHLHLDGSLRIATILVHFYLSIYLCLFYILTIRT